MEKRDFVLGSEWVYFKVYCGYKTANFILLDTMPKLLSELKEENVINTWFFIRYNDSDSHLRIRFKVNEIQKIGLLIAKFNTFFEPLLEQFLVWKIQTDTYQREIERYGAVNYETTEKYFQYDSEAVLEYLSYERELEDDSNKLYYSFLAIDSFLNVHQFTLEEKVVLLDSLQQSFKKEFSVEAFGKAKLTKSFKEIDFEKLLKGNMFSKIVETKTQKIKKWKASNPFNKNNHSFFSGHIHMMLNRQFTSRQREYEVVVYDHLFKYYTKLLKQ